MHPIHDVDALLLLAMTHAAKRRPADLVEVMAAADLVQGSIPLEGKLRDAIFRLSTHGLIAESEGGYILTPAAQQVMTGLPRKAETAERLFAIKEKLATYEVAGEPAGINLTEEQILDAITAYRSSSQGTGRNLLMPKPKQIETRFKREGQWRKPPLPRERKP